MPTTAEIDGCRISYTSSGAGEPVLFIQGVGLHGDGWLPQTEDLSNDFQCIRFDNRGMGASTFAGGKLSVEQMAADAVAVLDAAGVERAHVVGHSLGGVVAQEMALQHGDRVRSLALMCTSARGADATALSWKMLVLGLRGRIGTLQSRRRAFLEIVLPAAYLETVEDKDALAQELAPLFGHDLAVTPKIAMAQLRALGRYNSLDRLKSLAGVKTLVVSAAEDIIFPPRCGRALAAAIPGSKYIEIAGAAHGVPIQCADEVNQLLRAHLQN